MQQNQKDHPLPDAVQPDAWFRELPRAQYATLEPVAQPEAWFSVYRLPGNIYAIYEPGHFQEVISFLVIGGDSALLIDTGMGIGNMKAVTDHLWTGPLQVVNTHSHFDHIGGNHQYELVHILDHPAALRRMEQGLTAEEVADNMREGSNAIPYPDGFDPGGYHIRPCRCRPVADGHIFDLGGRSLQVIATPGHSPDSIMLADQENHILFTGDTVYPATLYAHLDAPDGLDSVVGQYHETLTQLARVFGGYQLICSHNEPLRPGSLLGQMADAFAAILEGRTPDGVDERGLKKHQFDGFAVVTK